jgi:hypothetical protein
VEDLLIPHELALIKKLLIREANRLHCKIAEADQSQNIIDESVVKHGCVNQIIGKIYTLAS